LLFQVFSGDALSVLLPGVQYSADSPSVLIPVSFSPVFFLDYDESLPFYVCLIRLLSRLLVVPELHSAILIPWVDFFPYEFFTAQRFGVRVPCSGSGTGSGSFSRWSSRSLVGRRDWAFCCRSAVFAWPFFPLALGCSASKLFSHLPSNAPRDPHIFFFFFPTIRYSLLAEPRRRGNFSPLNAKPKEESNLTCDPFRHCHDDDQSRSPSSFLFTLRLPAFV